MRPVRDTAKGVGAIRSIHEGVEMQLLRVLNSKVPESTGKLQPEFQDGFFPVARRSSCYRGFQTLLPYSVLDRPCDGSVEHTEKHRRRRRSASVTSPHYAHDKAERVHRH